MQREGGLAKMEAEYGYPCRNQEEFAVRHMLTLQLHDPMLIAVTSQASCKCLSVLNLGLWVVVGGSHASQCTHSTYPDL